jgi:hypothetical protein
MSRVVDSAQESKNTDNARNANVQSLGSSPSLLALSHLPLINRSQRIASTIKPFVQPNLKIDQADGQYNEPNSTQSTELSYQSHVSYFRDVPNLPSKASSESHFDKLRIFSGQKKTPAGYFAPIGLSHGSLPIVDKNDRSEAEAWRAGKFAEQASGPLESVSSAHIHTGPVAAQLAEGLNARAVTVGQNIVFGRNEYSPNAARGRALLAHELTHVRQQTNTGPRVALDETFESEGSRRAREFSRMTISILEDALLATLRRRGANRFLRQLRRQSSLDRRLLAESDRFLASIRAILRGYDLWNAEMMLGVDEGDMMSLGSLVEVNPYLSPSEQQEEERNTRRVENFRRLTFSIVRDPLLESLRQHNSIAFLRQLRAVSSADRQLLETDSTFLAQIRRYFSGHTLWIVRRLLRFGPRFSDLPMSVREFGWAVRDRDTTRVRELLRAYPELRSEQRTPGVRELLEYEFRRSPAIGEIRRILRERESHRGDVSRMTRAAHYDRPRGGGALQVRAYGGTRRFIVARTTSEVRVIVRIRFVHTTVSGTNVTKTNRTYYLSDSKRSEWRRQIYAAWNGRFLAVSGANRLPILFIPVFTDSNPHYTVGIVDREENFRSDMTTWWLHTNPSHKTIAHEFGHMLGAEDEYNLPGTTAEIPASLGLTSAERQRSSVQGITGTARSVRVGGFDLPGIMGSQHSEGAAGLPRHLWLVINEINRLARRPGETAFRVVSQ